jgi:hypothetical protein
VCPVPQANAGTASACMSCSIANQLSPTRSISSNDCMVIPKAVVSEVCPKTHVLGFNEPQFEHCQMTWTWDNLHEGYKKGEIIYKKGTLDKRAVPGTFESLVCVYGDPCTTDLINNFFVMSTTSNSASLYHGVPTRS